MKLKPCPFCGGKAESGSDANREEYINQTFGSRTISAALYVWIFCTECGSTGKRIRDKDYDGFKNLERESHMKDEAVKAWNHRAGKGGII